jgi:hypothetical protein
MLFRFIYISGGFCLFLTLSLETPLGTSSCFFAFFFILGDSCSWFMENLKFQIKPFVVNSVLRSSLDLEISNIPCQGSQELVLANQRLKSLVFVFFIILFFFYLLSLYFFFLLGLHNDPDCVPEWVKVNICFFQVLVVGLGGIILGRVDLVCFSELSHGVN